MRVQQFFQLRARAEPTIESPEGRDQRQNEPPFEV